jgi:hypothetical protein
VSVVAAIYFFRGEGGGHGAAYAFLGSVLVAAGLAAATGVAGATAGVLGAKKSSRRTGAFWGITLGLITSTPPVCVLLSGLGLPTARNLPLTLGLVTLFAVQAIGGGALGGLAGAAAMNHGSREGMS